jgi:hypothetical protein
VLATSSDWDSVYASVLATSSNWDSVYASVLDTSANWDSVYASVLATSSNWDSVYASVLDTSATWDSVYASVLDTSANWDSVYASVLDTSANWDSTHASVLTTSSNWDSVYTSVSEASSNWDGAYSFVNADSATNNTDYNRTTFVNTSGDTIDGDLTVVGQLSGTTAVFTSITALSTVVDVIDIKVRELSGYDIIDGDLRVDGDVTTDLMRLADMIDPLYYVNNSAVYNITDLETSKISDRYNYTHAINVFSETEYIINNVQFKPEIGDIDSTWEISGGTGEALNNENSTVPGIVGSLLSDSFRYIVDEQKITLKGLSVGKKYAFYLYSQAWSTDNITKRAIITCSSSDEILTVDQDDFEYNLSDGHMIEFLYTADHHTVEFTITPDANSSWHIYAFSNRDVWNSLSQTLVSPDISNFKSTYTNVYDNSGKWESVYSWVNSDSATNNTDYNRNTFVNVSGDTMMGSLSVQDNLVIDGTTSLSGQLLVDGYSSFTGGVTAQNNMYVMGDLRVDGNVWMMSDVESTLYVGESQDDVVVFQAPVDSSIVPFKTGIHDLGSEIHAWNNIYADGVTIGDYTLSAHNLSAIDNTVESVAASADMWNDSYNNVVQLTADTIGTKDRLDALYNYTISNFDKSEVTYEPSLEMYIRDEYDADKVNVGDTIIVAAENTVYVLINPDGTDIKNWVEVNAKPNTLFYRTNLLDGAVIDNFDLSQFRSAKYIIEIEGNGHVMFTELNMVTNGKIVTLTEYAINHTTPQPLVEFDATLNSTTSAVELRMLTPVPTADTLWNPGSLSSRPLTWLDAANADKVVIDSYGNFNRWDNSGVTDLRMYTTPGSEPEYITSGDEMQNNNNVLKFSGDTDYLQSDYVDGSSKGKWTEDPSTWFLVFKPTGVNNHHDYLLWFEQSDGQDVAIIPGDNDEFFGQVWMKENEAGNGAYPFTKSYSQTDLSDQWNIFELTIDPVNNKASIHLNGNLVQSDVDIDYTFEKNVEHMFKLHANAFGSQFADGYLGEFLVIDDYQRVQTEGYLAWKWGLQDKLPEDHVFKNVGPYMNLTFKGNRSNLF